MDNSVVSCKTLKVMATGQEEASTSPVVKGPGVGASIRKNLLNEKITPN